MVIGDGTSSIEITLREMGAMGTPASGDFGIDVRATTGATIVGGPFTGRNDTVWIGRDEWNQFLTLVRELDRTRHGEARVTAMSPAEFTLRLVVTDHAGHLAAVGWVGRQHAGRTDDEHDRVCFRIEIDPSTLSHLVSQFAALAAAGGER
jgi:hypothetical protein